MKKKHEWYHAVWELKIIRDGKVIYHQESRNALVDEGERQIATTFFRNEENPIEFYIRLCYDALDEGSTLATMQGEPTGNGYAPQLVERSSAGFPTLEQDGGDWRVASKEVEFTAVGGDIGPINTVVLATSADNSGKLLAYINLTQERTILAGDIGTAKMKIKFA